MMSIRILTLVNRFYEIRQTPRFSGSPKHPGEPRNPPISPHRRAQKNTPKPDRKIHLLKGPRHPENPQKPGKGHRIWNSGVPGGSPGGVQKPPRSPAGSAILPPEGGPRGGPRTPGGPPGPKIGHFGGPRGGPRGARNPGFSGNFREIPGPPRGGPGKSGDFRGFRGILGIPKSRPRIFLGVYTIITSAYILYFRQIYILCLFICAVHHGICFYCK